MGLIDLLISFSGDWRGRGGRVRSGLGRGEGEGERRKSEVS